MTSHRLLCLGGARSGKSRYAQQRAEVGEGAPVFIATAQPFDDEMHARIARHRADRDGRWHCIEAPLDLAPAIDALSGQGKIVLVDCLTLWLSNLLLAGKPFEAEATILTQAVARFDGTIILVANEVGWGIVPDNALARKFRDDAGRLNQHMASICDEVMLVVAGLPLRLK
ncbi:bifunctional adenosylcobinamide kinase/adenosylcobinamide-phosphate guanylyltransferase [Sphingobium lactosutens]|uniref:Bifunctional adenosylcobalamin biosynthesis protein n=1 Tax=Sphingobium lactosutens DS20 TaxID=1331060 RepID=T0HV38_9SPHN|nr:bifunctional adenosylcobinamide kinase/adenosylcobinamide-phosphate guanylyltransferase [Sphingobium lactosutens]EQB17002.1 adenosylcobinamide kinase [Sphingobium lactosutens DS20]